MHINHLIWDYIFTDPEFGGLPSIEDDRYGEMYKYEHGITYEYAEEEIIEELYIYIYKYNPWFVPSSHCRGIHVNILPEPICQYMQPPSLKISSALVLVNTLGKQLHMALKELKEMIGDVDYSYKLTPKSHTINQYLHHISKDVQDDIFRFTIQIYYTDQNLLVKYKNDQQNGYQFYSEYFNRAYFGFKHIFDMLLIYGTKNNLDSLQSLSKHVERVYGFIIQILQIYHELAYTISEMHGHPIVPNYYGIHCRIQERVHTRARYPPR